MSYHQWLPNDASLGKSITYSETELSKAQKLNRINDAIVMQIPELPSEWLELENKLPDTNDIDENSLIETSNTCNDTIQDCREAIFDTAIIMQESISLDESVTSTNDKRTGTDKEKVRNIYKYLIDDKDNRRINYTDVDIRYECLHSLDCFNSSNNIKNSNLKNKSINMKSLVKETHLESNLCLHLTCNKLFSEENRQQIFNNFWNSSADKKLKFFYKHIKRKINSSGSNKKTIFKFYLSKHNQIHEVCREFFLNTLAIDKTKIYYFFKLLIKLNTSNNKKNVVLLKPDEPVKKQHSMILQQFDEIRDHIRSFPIVGSNCNCKVNTNATQKYLQYGLNLNKMFQCYEKNVKNPLKICMYRRIFNEEFNYRFLYPKKHKKNCKLINFKLDNK